MNEQQRAAMQMAYDLLCRPVDTIAEMYCFGMGDCDETTAALREALAQPQGDKVCIDWDAKTDTPVMGYKAQPQGEHKTDGTPCWCNPEVTYENPETGAKVIVHKEPQGKWVDLTDYEIGVAFTGSPCLIPHQNQINGLRAVIAKFKEKNTPPAVPQGEPVAKNEEGRITWLVDNWPQNCLLYTTPPSVEAAIEATKEKVIEVVKNIDETHATRMNVIAAIRSMK